MNERERFLEEWRSGVGGSDIPIITGAAPWGSVVKLWGQKLNLLPPAEDNERFYWGRVLEPVVAARFKAEHPSWGVVAAPFFHRLAGHHIGHLDGKVDDGTMMAVLEIKTTASARAWQDEPPVYVQQQCQWYMHLTGYICAHVAALLATNTYREYEVMRDDAVIAELVKAADWFWGYVVRQEEPPADGRAETGSALAELHPSSDGPMIESTGDMEDKIAELRSLRVDRLAVEALETKAENELKQIIGDGAGVEGPWGKITWRTTKPRTAVNWQAVAKALEAPKSIIEANTEHKPGYRVFRVAWVEEQETEDGDNSPC